MCILSLFKHKKSNPNEQIEELNRKAEEQIANNKKANSIQSTESDKNTTKDDTKKLKTQKVPLNAPTVGATVGNPTEVGLNLGGY